MPRAASMMAGSMVVRPVYVLRTMGSSAYTVSATTAVRSPMPVTGMRKPNSAMDGMVYTKFTSASTGFAPRRHAAMAMPSDSPMRAASAMDMNEMPICWRSRSKNQARFSTSSWNREESMDASFPLDGHRVVPAILSVPPRRQRLPCRPHTNRHSPVTAIPCAHPSLPAGWRRVLLVLR